MGLPRLGIDASRGFAGPTTGTERYAREVILGLLASGRFNCSLYMRRAPEIPLPAGTDLRILTMPRAWTHLRLGLEVARRPPDLLYVPAHVMPLATRPPTVVTVHDLGYRFFPEAHPAAQRWYLDWTTRRHAGRARRVVADSRATRDDLVREYGADPAAIDVVPLGVGSEFQPDPEARRTARAALGVGADARVILHVGTLQPRKNLARLIEAFRPLAAAGPDAVLVLVGGTGWGADLRTRVRTFGLEGRVLFPGFVAAAALPGLYAAADVYAIPSLYEGFGLTALEAMACGVPVVAADASSLPEVVGDAAMLAPPQDTDAWTRALKRLLDDEALRRTLSEAGPRRAALFSWERTARGVADSLETALEAEAG